MFAVKSFKLSNDVQTYSIGMREKEIWRENIVLTKMFKLLRELSALLCNLVTVEVISLLLLLSIQLSKFL